MKIGNLIKKTLKRMRVCQQSMLGSELHVEDLAKKNGDSVNQRKKLFAEKEPKLKRTSPRTQSQLKTYRMNYLKHHKGQEDNYTEEIDNVKPMFEMKLLERKDDVIELAKDFAENDGKTSGNRKVDMVLNPPWNLPFLGAKGLTSLEQTTAHGKGISNPLMAVMVCQKPYGIQLTNVSSTERVNTPGSDENRLKLCELMYKIVKVADARVKD
ncbi:hypothetical protein Tco_0065249 [Tanacetum coccineum]